MALTRACAEFSNGIVRVGSLVSGKVSELTRVGGDEFVSDFHEWENSTLTHEKKS